MKLSKYNYIEKTDNKILLWNTVSGALVKFDNSFFDCLQKNEFNKLKADEIAALRKSGIIIAENINETKKVLNQRKKAMITRKNEATFTIALTESCNANCYYCYQHNNCNSKKEKVSSVNYEKIVDFICQQSQGKKVKIVWFGGEPLLKKQIIIYICNELHKRNIKYTSDIITNGLLLPALDIAELKEIIKVNKIQITFDGLYQKHNIRKGYTSTKDVFSIITKNIDALLKKGINIVIRVNISKQNYQELEEIINFCITKFQQHQNFKLYYEMVTDDSPNSEYAIPEKEREKYAQILFDTSFKYRKDNLNLPKRRSHFCGVQKPDSYFLDIYGNLYTCEHHIWNTNKIVGNINCFDSKEYLKQKYQSPLSKKCEQCVFLPVCQGGCVRCDKNECPIYVFNAKQMLKLMLHN